MELVVDRLRFYSYAHAIGKHSNRLVVASVPQYLRVSVNTSSQVSSLTANQALGPRHWPP